MMQAVMPPRDPMVPDVYRVSRAQSELAGVVTLEVEPVSGNRPAGLPGQFNMLYAMGIGEVAISISGETPRGFVHTIRAVGAVSGALAGMEEGAVLGLRGPYGTGWPVAEAEGSDVVFVAGGLGLAPLRPAIEAVLAARERYGRVTILAGCRSPREILFRHQLEHWRQRLDVEVQVTVDHADTEWRGNVGVVPSLIRRAAFDPDDTYAFICGPEVMMRFSATALQEANLPAERTFLSMERNMKCAIGLCGHCQFGPSFICKDGPVMALDRIAGILAMREI
ncbi:FAD/NAD(P)-binding protein [Novosphingobium mangrovi (ex Huang et al. 2023)]|uniref:FAD/NAD(P)-binding protein n=1 Tax=Novosphingobium mangrovi (ex Huang et al. 2023) TaxID=2976432 RepID=A0ABT2I0L1_9SPHN|nr:FAD/NAD(P)-binding protein [Novosphingobium mangrovi (ex Huang et al. 2023)]MCT2398341.1 FAD/NAD(P)-binding protein [Novosphingobium mangrovi (ex Huang et al. 2023)]